MADVLVVADPGSGSSGRALGSALAFAERIHRQAPGTTALLLLGHQIHELAESAAYSGVDRVLVADHPALADVAAEGLTATVAAVAADFSVTVGAATSFGKDLLPRVAARLDAGYVADCGDVSGDDGALVYRRAIFAGNAWERCRVETTHAVVSVRSSEVPPLERPRADTPAPIEAAAYVPAGAARGRIEVLGFEPTRGDRPDLTEARAVVAGGRMLQERFFELLEPLADELGAAIGATRAACDGGWAPGELQVGQTGKIVAPDLYVAVGISGAIQHVAGMRDARVVVAIDRDPSAPIFEIADYGLVADFRDAVPELTRLLAARRQAGQER